MFFVDITFNKGSESSSKGLVDKPPSSDNSSAGDSPRQRKKITSQSAYYEDDIFVDTFPVKLYNLLKSESKDVVEWLSHGESFRINDNDKFCNDIISKYFKRTYFQFFRLLLLYFLLR